MRTIESAVSSRSAHLQRRGEPGVCRREGVSSAVTVREVAGKGRGVFASAELAEGDVVIVGKPISVLSQRTWVSVQTGAGTHVRIDEPFERVNHSCDPSCGVRPNRHGGYDLVARRMIRAGEEITFDYCTTEWEIVGFDRCRCGSDRCRETVRGARHLTFAELEEFGEQTAPYLQALPV